MWLVKYGGDVYRPVQTSGSGQSTSHSAHWDVHQTSNTWYLSASASRDQTERDLQADSGHQSETHATVLQGGEYNNVKFVLRLPQHSPDSLCKTKLHQFQFVTVVQSRPVGIGTSLTFWLQRILAPFPIGTNNFSLLLRFQSKTGAHRLCYGCKNYLQGKEAARPWGWLVTLSGTEIKNA